MNIEKIKELLKDDDVIDLMYLAIEFIGDQHCYDFDCDLDEFIKQYIEFEGRKV